MTEILQFGDFIRRVFYGMRFGERSRGQLKLMRIEVNQTEAQCDWMARPIDVWDRDLPAHIAEKNFTMQALEDALDIRKVLFGTLSGVKTAELRAFRTSLHGEPELVLAGVAFRDDRMPALGTSLAMQARLLGFHFTVVDGSLIRLSSSPGSSYSSTFAHNLKEVS